MQRDACERAAMNETGPPHRQTHRSRSPHTVDLASRRESIWQRDDQCLSRSASACTHHAYAVRPSVPSRRSPSSPIHAMSACTLVDSKRELLTHLSFLVRSTNAANLISNSACRGITTYLPLRIVDLSTARRGMRGGRERVRRVRAAAVNDVDGNAVVRRAPGRRKNSVPPVVS